MYIYLLRLYNKQGSSSTLKLDKWIDHAINSGLLSGDVLVLWMQIMALIFIFLFFVFPSGIPASVQYLLHLFLLLLKGKCQVLRRMEHGSIPWTDTELLVSVLPSEILYLTRGSIPHFRHHKRHHFLPDPTSSYHSSLTSTLELSLPTL